MAAQQASRPQGKQGLLKLRMLVANICIQPERTDSPTVGSSAGQGSGRGGGGGRGGGRPMVPVPSRRLPSLHEVAGEHGLVTSRHECP